MRAKKAFNPFYPLLVLCAMAFGITACAYGVLTVKMLQPEGVAEVRESTGGLLFLLDHYGLSLLFGELAVLAVFTFAAIGTDDYWTRRAEIPASNRGGDDSKANDRGDETST